MNNSAGIYLRYFVPDLIAVQYLSFVLPSASDFEEEFEESPEYSIPIEDPQRHVPIPVHIPTYLMGWPLLGF